MAAPTATPICIPRPACPPADLGGGYAFNWPAAYGYGKVVSHPFKEEQIVARPAFVSVSNNVRGARMWLVQDVAGPGCGWERMGGGAAGAQGGTRAAAVHATASL